MGTAVEILAAATGLLGTLLLALRGPRAGWGFVLYLVSNAGWIWFAIQGHHVALLMQQVGFTATSAYGAYAWLWRDRLKGAELGGSGVQPSA
jgi:nicotinamide riboside transporter PnuC